MSENNPKLLYLCDGNIQTCKKDWCYKNGGECKHTTNEEHARNKDSHNFTPDDRGNLWEN